ncbi:hypothetical protein DFH06DRAFT_1319703 [Mycena polygramma]|nr:hypothetical protein DFH06DRAFT_1319703 [Mycena polygramma]
MRFTFTMMVIVAATFTSAAIVPRSNVSRMGNEGEEPASRREVEGRQGRTHPREFYLADVDIPQRRSADTYERKHPRDFPRREAREGGAEIRETSGSSLWTPSRRHPRDFPRRDLPENDAEIREPSGSALRTPGRRHPRDFRRHEADEGNTEIRETARRIHLRQFGSLD